MPMPTHDIEIGLILWLQARGPLLLQTMKFFTVLGDGATVLVLAAFFYWCLDERLGLRLLLLATVGTLFGSLIKLGLHAPRPVWVVPGIRALDAIHTFGLPSGHAVGAMTGWGLVATHYRRRWVTVLAVALIFLIGLSRVALGVHYPAQVLAGWALGGILLGAFLGSERRGSGRLGGVGLLTTVSLGALLLAVAIRGGLRDWNIPADWLVDQVGTGVQAPRDVLFSLEGIIFLSGGLLGIGWGTRYLDRRGGFRPAEGWNARALCFLLGMTGVIALAVLPRVLPAVPPPWSHTGQYVHVAVVGFWVTGGAPSVFRRLGWVSRRDEIPIDREVLR